MAFGGGGMSGATGLGFVMTLKDDVSAPAKNMGMAVMGLRKTIRALGMGFTLAGAAITAAGLGIGSVMVRGIKDAANYQAKLKTLQVITGATAPAIQKLGDEFTRIASVLPLSNAELVEMSIVAARLGVHIYAGLDGLKDMSVAATMAGKTLGFTGERMMEMTGRLATTLKLFDPETVYDRWDDAQKKVYKTMLEQGKDTSDLFGKQMIDNVKGLTSALTELSFMSSATADYMSDVVMRAAQGMAMFKMLPGEMLASAAILKDYGIEAQAGGTALDKTYRKMSDNLPKMMKGYSKLNDEFKQFSDKTMVDMVKSTDKGKEGVLAFLEAMGKQQRRDPRKMSQLLEEMGIKEVRLKRVFQALADSAATQVKVTKEQAKQFGISTEELEKYGKANADGSYYIGRLRMMQRAGQAAFDRGTRATEAFNMVSQTASMMMITLAGSFQTVSQQMGVTFIPMITDLLGGLVTILDAIFKAPQSLKAVMGVLMGVTSVVLILTGTFMVLAGAMIAFGGILIPALLIAVPLALAVTAALGTIVGALMLLKGEGQSVFGFISSEIAGVIGVVAAFFESFTKLLKDWAPYFLKPWKEAAGLIQGVVKGFMRLFGITGKLKDTADELGVSIGWRLVNALRKLGEKFRSVAKWALAFFTGFSQGADEMEVPLKRIWKALGKIGKAFMNLGKKVLKVFGLWKDDGKDAGETIEGAMKKGEKTGERFVKALEKIANFLDKIPAKIDNIGEIDISQILGSLGNLKEGLDPILEGLAGFGEQLKLLFGNTDSSISDTATALNGFAAAFSAIGVVIGHFFNLMGLAMNAIKWLIVIIPSTFKSMWEIFKTLPEVIGKGFELAGMYLNNFFIDVKIAASKFEDWFGDLFLKILKSIPGIGRIFDMEEIEKTMDTQAEIRRRKRGRLRKDYVSEGKIATTKQEMASAFDPAMEKVEKEAAKITKANDDMLNALDAYAKRADKISGVQKQANFTEQQQLTKQEKMLAQQRKETRINKLLSQDTEMAINKMLAREEKIGAGEDFGITTLESILGAQAAAPAMMEAVAPVPTTAEVADAITVENQVENVVNFETSQQFDVDAQMTCTIPGIAERIDARVDARMASQNKKETVTQGSE